MAAYEREPGGGNELIAGLSADNVGEILEHLEPFGGMRPLWFGDTLHSWDARRCQEMFTMNDFPIKIAKIMAGIDGLGLYRDVYHFEGALWCYQLRHRPDIRYPEGLDRSHLHERQPIYQKWAYHGDERAFVRDLVQAKLMLLV